LFKNISDLYLPIAASTETNTLRLTDGKGIKSNDVAFSNKPLDGSPFISIPF
jgi:hypothetical protein